MGSHSTQRMKLDFLVVLTGFYQLENEKSIVNMLLTCGVVGGALTYHNDHAIQTLNSGAACNRPLLEISTTISPDNLLKSNN